eukprot:4377230-Pleurochrysis_carterae.AAC.1
MVNTPTQRESLGAVASLGSLKLHDGDADWGTPDPDPKTTEHPRGLAGAGAHRKQLYLLVRKRMVPSRPAALEIS